MDDAQAQKIFLNLVDENLSIFTNLKARTKNYNKAFLSIQNKINRYLRSTCAKELGWFEKNGKVEDAEKGFRLSINDGVDKVEANERMHEYVTCSRKNDFGLESFFMKMLSQQKSTELILNNYIENCLKTKRDDEKQLRDCLTSCFNPYFGDMNNTLDSIDQKIDEVDKKLL
jgi:hypothetical protein